MHNIEAPFKPAGNVQAGGTAVLSRVLQAESSSHTAALHGSKNSLEAAFTQNP